MTQEQKRNARRRTAQFEPAALRESVKLFPSAQGADHRTENAGCQRFFQRPEQVFFLRSRNHDSPVRRDAESRQPVTVKPSALLCVARRCADTKAFAARAADLPGQAQRQRKGHAFIARPTAEQLMKALFQQAFGCDIWSAHVGSGMEKHNSMFIFCSITKEAFFIAMSTPHQRLTAGYSHS